MKSKIVFALLSLVAANVFAAQSSSVKTLQVAFPCDGDQVQLNATPAINYITATHVGRFNNFSTNQVFMEGQQLVMQASDGTSTVLGTLKDVPYCYATDPSDMPVQYYASWNALELNPAVKITETLSKDAKSCRPSGLAAGGFFGKSMTAVQVLDTTTGHAYNQSWSFDVYFPTMESCQVPQ